MKTLSIILLWWSRTPQLETMAHDCLDSVLSNTIYPNYEVIIIENKSLHPSRFLRQFKHSKVRIFHQQTNLGFVKGNNLGIKLADGNDVLLLNNDTIVPRGWLEPIVFGAEHNEDCGMIMPMQIHKGSNEYLKFNGRIPNIVDYLTNKIKQDKNRNVSGRLTDGNWLPLCATIITRRAIDKVGILDENFALGGFEDVDYSWRCLDAGLSLYVASGSAIYHHYGQSFHHHIGYAETWVEKGKYLMKKHNAKQDSLGNVYRRKDKPNSWKPV